MRPRRVPLRGLLMIFAACLTAAAPVARAQEEKTAVMKKLTPVLMVEEIEPSLPFWTRLGFERAMEVAEGERLGFVMMTRDDVEVMYQSYEGLAKDLPAVAKERFATFLYLEVDDLDSVISRLGEAEVLVPRRDTFYGMSEIVVREPGGHVVAFAMPNEATEEEASPE